MIAFTLSELLYPLSDRDFLAQHFQRGFLHIPGTPEKFARLFSWESLNSILEQHRLEPPYIMVRKDNKDIDPDDYLDQHETSWHNRLPQINAGKMAALFRDGATLSLHEFHWTHKPLALLLQNLSLRFKGPCDVILFASFGSTRAIEPHEDGDDQFIVQVAGRKHWKVFGSNEPNPIRKPIWHESTDPKRPPIWEGMLNQGDVLYLPRGWWHEVRSINEPSLHLTIGLPVHTGVDLIHWALPRLAKEDLLRENLPTFGDCEARRAFRERILRSIEAALHRDILDDYFDSIDADSRPAFANPMLPWSAMPEGSLPSDQQLVLRYMGLGWTPIAGEGFVFRAVGRDWSFPREARAFLQPLLDGQALTLARVRELGEAKLPTEQVNRLLSRALREGLISVG